MAWLLGGEADPALLKRLGLDPAELEARLERSRAAGAPMAADETADAARLIALSGFAGGRRMLALLVRGALLEQLAAVRKPAELRDLTTALSRIPQWVFDEVVAQPRAAGEAGANPGADEGGPAEWHTEDGEPVSDALRRRRRQFDAPKARAPAAAG